MISICALVPYPLNTAPSQRFRIEQWLPQLRTQGIGVQLLPFADDRFMRLLYQPGRWPAKVGAVTTALIRRIFDIVGAGRYDAILVHRAACLMGPALLERLTRLCRRPIIFDFDDAVFLCHTSHVNRRWGWLKFPGKTAALCKFSAQVTVGNAFLADYARQHNPHVTVIPSSVDTDCYRPVPRNGAGRRIVVGWTGSSTSQTYLEQFVPLLRDLTARPDVELRVHSDRPPVVPGVPFVWRPWSPATEREELAAFDVGIMPMPDTPWAKGKCAMKALLYMAMGIPAVCSAVGANCDVIQHEANGLLALTPDDWNKQLIRLITDRALREKLGQAGRQTVESRYSMQHCATQFAQVVRQAVG